ncbi:unnamed protein product [Pleuronectes platessa]|uniref:Uncharacterized protein n=1 Tax=Pleuronectes platessa TaxID=8262 RepID=A0A9N7TWD5_PLEPL|nr:unnamed protein product [Pleuronectes platessa]
MRSLSSLEVDGSTSAGENIRFHSGQTKVCGCSDTDSSTVEGRRPGLMDLQTIESLPATAIRPLQLIQNAAARLVLTNLNSLTLLRSSTPFTGYQWLPVSGLSGTLQSGLSTTVRAD